MGPDEYIRQALQEKATPVERDFFSGKRLAEISSFAQDIHNSDAINSRHVDYFSTLFTAFGQASTLKPMRRSFTPRFENERLMEDSVIHSFDIGLSAEDHRGKTLYAINSFNAAASPAGFFFSARPMPVKWHMEHINQRCIERKSKPLDSNDWMFIQHNAMAASMLRIFEDDRDADPNAHRPFILPERRGILVGHTMQLPRDTPGNRIHLLATRDISAMQLSPYINNPYSIMTVRTFLGPDEMSPAMTKMRYSLLDFYKPQKMVTLFNELNNWDKLEANKDRFPPTSDDIAVMSGLKNLMNSPLWDQTARLPVHLQPRHHRY